jgi:transcriptional regulator with XRE-family HTH domain
MDTETLQMVIGPNIAKYREEKGFTQAKLAELIGVTPVFVSRVERGQKMMKVMTLYTAHLFPRQTRSPETWPFTRTTPT